MTPQTSIKILLFSIMFLMLDYSFLSAQERDTLRIGEVKGTVADTAYRIKLQSATLAIYLEKDSSLVQYQLSNNSGVFWFSKLPVNVPLYLVTSYVGYEKNSTRFILPRSDPNIDLKTIGLRRAKTQELEEVILTYIPPVRMNGDTLEFNADAFKLDQSAVVEDLLRKLPGVTVWGDGVITVNGKEVSSVKVDGKPFLTGDPKIATQNLSKDAVDKIQVYQKHQDPSSRRDSISEINIKLKKGKNFGGFGKVAAGTNFSNRQEAEISFNLFNPRSQAGFVWAKNNVNKIPKDVNTILRNATFKGISNSLEYSPDFELAGINRSHSGGFVFQHDFIPDPGLYKNNRINSNYFLQELNSTIKEQSKTLLDLTNASPLAQLDSTTDNVRRINHALYTQYNLRKKGKIFDLNASLKRTINDRDLTQTNSTYTNEGALLNESFMTNKSQATTQTGTLSINAEQDIWTRKSHKFPKKLNYSYAMTYNDNAYEAIKQSDFATQNSNEENRSYNRSYNNKANGIDHALGFSIGSLTPLLFGNGKLARITTTFTNEVKVYNSDDKNKVADWDSTLGLYMHNNYLSNDANYRAITETPSMRLSRILNMNLANRYFKTFNVSLDLKGSFFWQQHHSNHAFQVFQKNYSDFIPTAHVSFTNYQLGRHRRMYTLDYARTVGYPTPSQLVPLVDSSNNYFMQLANPNLKQFKKDEISFNLSHETFASNVFNYNINASVGKIDGALGDHISIDDAGRSKQYLVNLNGYRYFLIGGNLKKSIRTKNAMWQFTLNGQLQMRNSPNIINDVENISYITTRSVELGILYSFKELLGFEWKQSYFNYASKQRNTLTEAFQSPLWTTSFAGTLQFTKRLRFCSDIQYKNSSTSFSDPIHYSIWNAHLILRTLKSNNLECKLSALDMLGQNNVLHNFGDNNVITQRISNSLPRYYQITLAFYPRKFGKSDRKSTTD